MVTGGDSFRTLDISAGASWTNANASPTSQVFGFPLYRMRSVPTATMTSYKDALTRFFSVSHRQRLGGNGAEIEMCGRYFTDGTFFRGGRVDTTTGLISEYRALAVTGGNHVAYSSPPNGVYPIARYDDFYWYYNIWVHEYIHVEDFNWFAVPASRPAGYESYSIISDHPPLVSLLSDCAANGGYSSLTDRFHFVVSFRLGHALEAKFGTPTPKTAVRVASQTNVSVPLTGLYNFDGVTLTAGDRVLAGFQTNPADSGIYIAASGAWSRASDANTAVLLPAGTRVQASAGPNAGRYFALYTTGTVTLGTTPLIWHDVVMLNSAGPGTTGGTPQSRVDRFVNHYAAVGVTL